MKIREQILQALHSGYEKGDPGGCGSGKSRNGHGRKMVTTDTGPFGTAGRTGRATPADTDRTGGSHQTGDSVAGHVRCTPAINTRLHVPLTKQM